MGGETFREAEVSLHAGRIDLAEAVGLRQLQVKTWTRTEDEVEEIVLQGGGLESPTKTKRAPKKNCIPSSEQPPRTGNDLPLTPTASPKAQAPMRTLRRKTGHCSQSTSAYIRASGTLRVYLWMAQTQ
ncbi:hypothetical protein FQN60_009340 [Etheostoma spectabile]|uniref:Uncharacterized protein n=1 Tax=Etheostoma spectabile TaxID=54343 RepID=A0A5J5DIM1_9PERO|nr:hypothetical protein FQN60_009340 [Etheostoma spectabile]